MKPYAQLPTFLLAALALAGCGSSDNDDDGDGGTPEPPPGRGTLVVDPPPRVGSYSAADLAEALGATREGQLMLELSGTPLCRIDVHHLEYRTVGARDEDTTASGALMVPSGLDERCRGERPVLLYAHGTNIEQGFNLAEIEDPRSVEALLMALTFVGQGYIVIAPNYAGFDTSSLDYHAYLHAEQSAKEMVDALTAARSALPTEEAPLTEAGNRLFVTGYSQGGHVAMATHRELEAEGETVTASAPMSGPYALAAFGDAVFYGQVNNSAPLLLTLILVGYQEAYGDIYSSPSDLFEEPYAQNVESLFPSSVSRSQLFEDGLLPREHLFSSTAPDPAYEEYTPATQPEELATVFAQGFGDDALITNSYRLAYLEDAQANPDGGFPETTTGEPASSPEHPLRQAFKANDLRNWTPESPMLLCGGNLDPTVFFMNTELMQGYWAATDAEVTVLDVDGEASTDDPYREYKEQFDIAKDVIAAEAIAQGADDGGAAAVLEAYHSTLVPPFCLAAVRDFFEGFENP